MTIIVDEHMQVQANGTYKEIEPTEQDCCVPNHDL